MDGLALRAGDTATVVDNRRRPDRPQPPAGVQLVVAADAASSYHARNAGWRRGANPWVLFLDDDVTFGASLVGDLLAVEPGPRTAVLAGAIEDAPGPGAAARYAVLTRAMA